MNENKQIILLCCEDDFSKIVYNAVNPTNTISKIIIEEHESKKKFLTRRIKRLGIFEVAGQLMFQIGVAKPLLAFSKKRINQILEENNLNRADFPEDKIIRVKSINQKQSLDIIKEINPDLILINGTRILSKKLLSTVPCKFINIHAGITPKYRGVHGGYWALANKDAKNAGVTVHYVDEGIDTGNIIEQSFITIQRRDNFATYPYLQIAKGVESLKKVVNNFFKQETMIQNNDLESKLYYHPTIWKYFYLRIFHKIK